MKQKKLAIVTSYDDLCGNAEYSDALKNGLSDHYQVSIIRLNVDIIRGMKRRIADKFILRIAEQLKDFDLVNIQFEAGLFGLFPRDVLRRFLFLVKRSKKLIVTMHRLDIQEPVFSDLNISYAIGLKFKKFLKNSLKIWKNNKFASLYRKIIKICVKKNAAIIVHTEREKNRIEVISNYKVKVFDHPVAFLSLAEADYYRKKVNKPDFLAQSNLPANAVTIGAFGFISDYKGINVLINSLVFLPEHFHVLMFGAQHPMKVKMQPKGDKTLFAYINMLLPKLEKPNGSKKDAEFEAASFERTPIPTEDNNIFNRFHFMGGFHNHDDFVKAVAECDVVVFPYQEVGQSGSGVVAVALDLGANIVCSQNLSFLELIKYTGPAIRTFSIGNHLEFAEKIKIAVKNGLPSQEATQEYNKKYNLTTNAKFYADIFEAL